MRFEFVQHGFFHQATIRHLHPLNDMQEGQYISIEMDHGRLGGGWRFHLSGMRNGRSNRGRVIEYLSISADKVIPNPNPGSPHYQGLC